MEPCTHRTNHQSPVFRREALQEDREGRLHTSLDEEMYKAKRRRYGEKIWCLNGGCDAFFSYFSPIGCSKDQVLLGLEW